MRRVRAQHAGPQFQQLQMFATPEEVGHMWAGDYTGKKVGEVYDDIRSSDEPYMDGLAKDVHASGGFATPVMVAHSHVSGGDPLLVNGHHRAALAAATGRLIPVHHYDGAQEAYDDIAASEDDVYRPDPEGIRHRS